MCMPTHPTPPRADVEVFLYSQPFFLWWDNFCPQIKVSHHKKKQTTTQYNTCTLELAATLLFMYVRTYIANYYIIIK